MEPKKYERRLKTGETKQEKIKISDRIGNISRKKFEQELLKVFKFGSGDFNAAMHHSAKNVLQKMSRYLFARFLPKNKAIEPEK